MKKTKVGIIGCGNISDIYFKNLTTLFPFIEVKSCCDLVKERTDEKEEKYNVHVSESAEALLADPEIEIVLNLTTPPFHASVNKQIIAAKKHLYVEKPWAGDFEEGKAVLLQAEKAGLYTGCAPDTFLGGAIQTCRQLIDNGVIGEVKSAFAFMNCHGHESWHPGPEFYYQKGGGPMLDMGPYYLTALVNLVSPIKTISAHVNKALDIRTMTSEKRNGDTVKVEVPTHLSGTIGFENGAVGTIVTSFDVWKSDTPRIEIHGTKGSLSVPDPNTFGGTIKLLLPSYEEKNWREVPHFNGYAMNSRGLGLADMALAIVNKRKNRASGALGLHVLETMLAFEKSSIEGKHIVINTKCEKPEPLPVGINLNEAW